MEPGHHGTDSPYVLLGVEEDTGFDAIQAAKAKKLASCGDDPQAKARIEAAYDAVLMDRLKQRQAGKVSSGAVSASQEEAKTASPLKQLKLPALPQLPIQRASRPAPGPTGGGRQLQFALAEGPLLWRPLLVDSGLLAWVVILSPSADVLALILALGTGMTVLNLLWRHGRLLLASLQGFAGLAIGLVMGALLAQSLAVASPLQELQISTTMALIVQLVLAITLA